MFDPVSDKAHAEIPRIFSIIDPPAFVKQAKVDDFTGLPLAAYAGPGGSFPVHTKPAAWLSCAYFLLHANDLESRRRAHVEKRLKAAAAEHGFDFEQLRKTYQEKTASESLDADYALETERDGRSVKLYPLPNAESVKQAALHLYRNRARLPYAWRTRIARKILERAQEQNLQLPNEDYITKAAGMGAADPKQTALQVRIRARIVQHKETRQLLNKYAAEIQQESFSLENLRKCAALLGRVDETFGLTRLYDQDLPTPEEALFDLALDQAKQAQVAGLQLKTGDVITDAQLRQINLTKAAAGLGHDFLHKALGDHAVVTLSRFKAAAAELPEVEAVTLLSLLPKTRPELEAWSFLANNK